MPVPPSLTQPVRWRSVAAWSLIAGLCLAGLAAIVALLGGTFDDTGWRVVGTSLGFSVFASTTAAGGALRLRPDAWARALGGATVAASAAAYALLLVVLWIDDADAVARAFGIAGLAALWTSHASLVLRAVRPGDAPLLRRLTGLSVVALGIDTAVGILALLGALDDAESEPFARMLAALLVVALLATVLVPILRRLAARPAPAIASAWPGAPGRLAIEVAAATERLAAMELPPEARAEVARLRDIARDAGA